MAGQSSPQAAGGIREKLTELLMRELRNLASAAGQRSIGAVGQKVSSVTDRLTEYAKGQGRPGLVAALTGTQKRAEGKSRLRAAFSGGLAGIKEKFKGLFGRGKGKRAKKLKLTNIEEALDVGVPVRVAYNEWTQYENFPSFMKKVQSVDRPADEKTNWKAKIFWSQRQWEATTIQQVPDHNIVWRSKGPKGHVDGSVTFHELAPDMTRILLVMEYYPKGLFERTGNLWRAQGRRARLELKHFRRHLMTQAILNPDEVEGWRGEIRDGQVVKDHETAMNEAQEAREREQGGPEDRAPDEHTEHEGEHKEEEEVPQERQARPARPGQDAARTR
ncbi:SRPBCC family protein [Dactylosporangium fulvum]|uniref:SRPBCC family protein n=1 Tax=Dactylosporangium fulvum TaxID=53359 RepID=A0ABY5W831_9ACTN|nr:SRPBCC family protein [Dactylosporangium fulvum]UWP85476.1 SRPBCC family protein [Dactylosporangium fulvum]